MQTSVCVSGRTAQQDTAGWAASAETFVFSQLRKLEVPGPGLAGPVPRRVPWLVDGIFSLCPHRVFLGMCVERQRADSPVSLLLRRVILLGSEGTHPYDVI